VLRLAVGGLGACKSTGEGIALGVVGKDPPRVRCDVRDGATEKTA